MKAPLSYVPALPAAVGLPLGIIMANGGIGMAAAITCACAFAFLYLFRYRYLSFYFLMGAAGAALFMASAEPEIPAWAASREGEFYGEVVSMDPLPGQRWECVLRVDEIKFGKGVAEGKFKPFLCILRAGQGFDGIEPNARILYTGRLYRIEEDPDALPYSNVYAQQLLLNGITAEGFLYEFNYTLISPGYGLRNWTWRMRNRMCNALISTSRHDPTCAFLIAAVTGDRSFLDPDLRADFSASGLAHILALSGLHVGVLASILAFAFMPLRLTRWGMAAQDVATALLVWAFALFTGMGPSVVRAAVMLSIFLGARLLQRGHAPANAWCAAVAVTLAIDPRSLFSPGFQMSFAAVAAILVFISFLPKWMHRRPVLLFCISAVGIPASAMLGTGLIAAYHFGNFPVYFLLANLIAGPIATWLIGVGFVLMFIGMRGLQAGWLAIIAKWLYVAMAWISQAITMLPGHKAAGIAFSGWVFVPYFLALALAICAVKLRGVKGEWGRAPIVLACAAAGMAILIPCISACTRTAEPATVVCIPAGRSHQGIVVLSGQEGRIIPLGRLEVASEIERRYNYMFSRYLDMRGCDSLRLAHGAFRLEGAALSNSHLIAGHGKCARIFEGKGPFSPSPVQVAYAIVSSTYAGTPRQVIDACRPDTILVTANMNNKRLDKFMRECPDSVPCILVSKNTKRLF